MDLLTGLALAVLLLRRAVGPLLHHQHPPG